MSRLQTIPRWCLRNLNNLSHANTNGSSRSVSCLAFSSSTPSSLVGSQKLRCAPSISDQFQLGVPKTVLSRGYATKSK